MYIRFDEVQVGDEIKVRRGRSRDQIRKVYHVTAKTFDVEGFGRFLKVNGKGYGDSDSWFGRYASIVEEGDAERIAAANARQADSNAYKEHCVRDFNDDELARVATIIRECNARLNLEEEQYAEKEAAAEAAQE